MTGDVPQMPTAAHGHQLQYQEVECAPSFRLVIHTQRAPHELPAEIAANTCVVNYLHARNCLTDEFLDLFMRQEKSRLFQDRVNVIQVTKRSLTVSLSVPCTVSACKCFSIGTFIGGDLVHESYRAHRELGDRPLHH